MIPQWSDLSMMADVSVTTTNEIHGQVIQFFEVVWGMGDLVGSVPWKWRSKILNDGRMAWERWSLGLKYNACHDKQDSSRPHKAYGNKSLGDLERGITWSGLSLFNDSWSQKGHSVLCITTSFSTLANNQIWHQTVQQIVGCQPGDCRIHNIPQGGLRVCMG